MKTKLTLLLTAFTLTLAIKAPSPFERGITSQECASFCMRAFCPGQACGLYTNSSGQTVCGCH